MIRFSSRIQLNTSVKKPKVPVRLCTVQKEGDNECDGLQVLLYNDVRVGHLPKGLIARFGDENLPYYQSTCYS